MSELLSFYVFIPSSAQDGDVDEMVLRATSELSSEVSAVTNVTTVALYPRMPRLLPAHLSGGGSLGGMVEYTLTLWNVSVVSDTIELSIVSDWGTYLPETTLSLESVESTSVTVYVYIPAGEALGEMEVATLTATSQSDILATDNSWLDTYAGEMHLYLPITIK